MVSPIIKMTNTEKHSGVSGIPTQLLVLHSGESPLRGGYAQSLTQWANIPLSQGGPEASWHWFVDPIAIVSMVDPLYAAWHASEANPLSEGFEQAGYARFSRTEWLTPEGVKQMDNLAWLMAQRAKANGIPAVWLSTAQVTAITSGRDRTTKGFCTHRQIDPETRTDPGDGFPYDLLMSKVKAYMGGTAPAETKEWDEMATRAEFISAFKEAAKSNEFRTAPWGLSGARPGEQSTTMWNRLVSAHEEIIKANARLDGLTEAFKQVATGQGLDPERVAAVVEESVARALAKGVVNVEVTVADKTAE